MIKKKNYEKIPEDILLSVGHKNASHSVEHQNL
jgi:hypothetical protein